MQQWYLDIRKYAPELLDMEHLDLWPRAVKESQKGWIGKQNGKVLETKIGSSPISIFIGSEDFAKCGHAQYLALNAENEGIIKEILT